MFSLIYLPEEDREKLRLLRDEIGKHDARSPEYKKMLAQIKKIEDKRKPLRECTIEETINFQKFVAMKIQKAGAGGKLNHATMMGRQLAQIQGHLRTLYYKEGLQQELEQKRREEEKKNAAKQDSPAKAKPRKLQSQWTIDIGDLD